MSERRPLRYGDETAREHAAGYENGGWCGRPFLGVPPPGDVGLDGCATCLCGKRVRVTKRGLYAHHKRGGRP